MNKNLIDLSKEYAFIHHELMASGGEITEDLEIHIQSLYKELAMKVDSISYVLDKLSSESDYWNEKSKTYKNISLGCDKARDRIKDMIKYSMHNMDCTEIEGVTERLKITGGRFKLVIDNESLVPDSFKKQTIITEIDKEKLKIELEKGINVNGAHLEEIKSLRILTNRKRGE